MSSSALESRTDTATLEVAPMPAALGAEVRGIALDRIDDVTFASLYRLLLEHVVIVCRGQRLVPQDIVNLVRRFGTPVTSNTLHQSKLEERTANQVFGLPPEITVVTNVRENDKAIGILGDGEVTWHSDFSFKEKPTAARMLYAVEIPPAAAGGKTYFLNCYAAYDALPQELKQRIVGLTIKQANIVDTAMKLRPGARLDEDVRTTKGPSHPIISTHPETGANMLFLGRRHAAYVNGCTLEESEALLEQLWAHATQPQFCYVHHWAVGDVVIWDNRAVLHKRDPFDPQTRRVLYAAQVEGHRPFEAADALARPVHARYRAFQSA